jgi:hypothetical protein
MTSHFKGRFGYFSCYDWGCFRLCLAAVSGGVRKFPIGMRREDGSTVHVGQKHRGKIATVTEAQTLVRCGGSRFQKDSKFRPLLLTFAFKGRIVSPVSSS